MSGAEIHAQMLRESPVTPDGRPYGCTIFGGDIDENALCIATRSMLDRMTPTRPLGRIIEIGSGGGRWSRYLATLTDDLVCVDATDATADHVVAVGLHPTVIICKDGGLPSRPGQVLHQSANLVFSFDTFVHFNEPLFRSYLSRIADALKPGGLLILHHGSDSHRQPDQPIDQSGCWHCYADEWIDTYLAGRGLSKAEQLYATEGFGSRVVSYLCE